MDCYAGNWISCGSDGHRDYTGDPYQTISNGYIVICVAREQNDPSVKFVFQS